MKNVNLTKAVQSSHLLYADLQGAYLDAVKSENEFAILVIDEFRADFLKLSTRLKRIEEAWR